MAQGVTVTVDVTATERPDGWLDVRLEVPGVSDVRVEVPPKRPVRDVRRDDPRLDDERHAPRSTRVRREG